MMIGLFESHALEMMNAMELNLDAPPNAQTVRAGQARDARSQEQRCHNRLEVSLSVSGSWFLFVSCMDSIHPKKAHYVSPP